MDLRQLSQTPTLMEPNSVQRRPSVSSLSSASGYASSTYGGRENTTNVSTTAIHPNTTGNSFMSSRVTQSRHFGTMGTQNVPSLQTSPRATANANLGFGQQQQPQQSFPNQQQGQGDFNPSWLPQQTNAMLNVGPWIEQQAQVAPNLNVQGLASLSSLGQDLEQMGNSRVATTATTAATPQKKLEAKSDSEDGGEKDEDLIPTAIVIKNIPFAIKKEQLLEVMTKLSLPLPYAFNYHFDNGVFRGLAFANFTSTDEASLVVNQLNGREIGGRKLRVEYKKMLPLAERERIEREKREKRGQLEEQHRSTSTTSLASMYSTVSAPATTPNANGKFPPTPVNPSTMVMGGPDRLYATLASNPAQLPVVPSGLDMNDPETLEIYSQFLLFRDDRERVHSELAYPSSLSANQRRVIPLVCAFLGLSDTHENGLVMIKRFSQSQQQQPPSLIRSQSYNLAQSQTGAIAGQGGRYRQQSPRNVSGNMSQPQQPQQQQAPLQQQHTAGSLSGSTGFGQAQPQSQQQASVPPPGLQGSNTASTSNLVLNAAMLRGPRPNNSQLNLFSAAQTSAAKQPLDFRLQQQSHFMGMMGNSPQPLQQQQQQQQQPMQMQHQPQQQQQPFMAFNNGSSSSVHQQKPDDLSMRLDYLSFR